MSCSANRLRRLIVEPMRRIYRQLRKVGRSPKLPQTSGAFWALCVVLLSAFLFGGGARPDIQSLMVLRPLAVLLLGYGLWGLRLSHLRANKFLFAMAASILGLTILQIIPLPSALWSSLPGRGLIIQIDQAAGLGPVWRPLSLTPDATRNALYAELVPFAVLLLGVRLDANERFRLLGFILLLGGISALMGLAQTLGDPHGPLYFYQVTNNGSAVGLFANRNHQALLLATMLPMLATYVRGQRSDKGRTNSRKLMALLLGIFLLPLILITGSRSGLVAAVAGLLLIPAIIRQRASVSMAHARSAGGHRRERVLKKFPLTAMLPLLGAALVILTIWLGRGLAWDRLFENGPADDMRSLILPTMFAMIVTYLPFGSGFGSFEKVYQVHEPDALLDPTYMNHAHNDWLEVIMTGGLPALVLLVAALIAFSLKARQLFAQVLRPSRASNFARLGLLMILLAAIASLSDYPLRVPSLSCLFVVALLWVSCPLQEKLPTSATEQ